MFGTILLIAAVSLLIYAVAKRTLSRSPPGPIEVPGLGLLPALFWRSWTNPGHRWFLMTQELNRRYGSVVSFHMGTQEFVLISGYETLREAFVTNPDKFLCRSNTNYHKFRTKRSGIVGSEGALWQEHRRFAARVLKDFGFGRNISEQHISEEVAQIVAYLGQKDGQKVDSKDFVSKSVANVITRFIFSTFSSFEDPEFNEFLHMSSGVNNQNILGVLTAFYRWLPVETALALSPSNRRHFDSITWIEEVSRRKVEAIRRKYNVSDEPSNYVEAYLQEQHRRGSDIGSFTDFQLVKTIWELNIAGVDTSSSTLRWCLLYAALNLDMQDRCHAEIVAKIGKRPVALKDKKELHYCQAFLDEAQRISTLAAHSVEHRACKDTEFHGYKISSNAIILTNLYGLHHDERHFPKPDNFDPERFLTKEGQYKPSEFLNQFSFGKRSCLGEALARMELFMFLVTYFQHFRFEPDSSWTPERRVQILLGTEGAVHAPMHHDLILRIRG